MLNRGLLAVVYSLTILLGLLTVVFPAASIGGVIGDPLTYAYGVLLILGAAGALVGIIIPNYKVELVFLWLVAGGYLCYDIALWGLFAERVGLADGLPPPYGPALAVGVLTAFLAAKILFLTRKNRALVRAADHDRLG